MHTIVVIPTYNEIDNVEKMINAVLGLDKEIDILIVDDSSPDGTGKLVKSIMEQNDRVHILENKKKNGIGPAYIGGFKEALKLNPKYVVQMDADFSHNPEVIKEFLENIKENDLVIGSRYSNGISVIRWPLSRLLLSYFANIYVRFVLGMKVYDTTGGFKCFSADILKTMNFEHIHSNGYSFQIEVNYAFERNGFRVKEIPIIFFERRLGISKMSKNIIVEALVKVVRLRFRNKKKYFNK